MIRRRHAAVAIFYGLALFATPATPTFADTAKLVAGDKLPVVDAQSLTGSAVRLPEDQKGRPFVAIFGFSRGSGDRIAQWSHTLHAVLPASIDVYAIADLSHVPGLFRGFAIRGIRKQASPIQPEHDRDVLLLIKSNQWQDLVPAGGEDDGVVVATDAAGTILAIERVPYSEAEARNIATIFERSDATTK
jgi:hypothetical protein